jgi:hypothetical protein
MPPSYRQANSSGYAVKAGEVNGYVGNYNISIFISISSDYLMLLEVIGPKIGSFS